MGVVLSLPTHSENFKMTLPQQMLELLGRVSNHQYYNAQSAAIRPPLTNTALKLLMEGMTPFLIHFHNRQITTCTLSLVPIYLV